MVRAVHCQYDILSVRLLAYIPSPNPLQDLKEGHGSERRAERGSISEAVNVVTFFLLLGVTASLASQWMVFLA